MVFNFQNQQLLKSQAKSLCSSILIGIAEVIKDEEGLLAGIDDVLGVLKDDKVGCGGYYRAVKSHMEYGIKVIDSAELVSISITLAPSSAEYYVSRKEKKND